MISLKSGADLDKMRDACRIAAEALRRAGDAVAPGITTLALDDIVRRAIEGHGAVPSFLGYNGFPASACISINEQVIHGIPGDRVIKPGDIVSIDVGAVYRGFNGDCAETFTAGPVSEQARRLIDITRQCFFEGVKFAREGYRIRDLSAAVQNCAEQSGYSVVRDYTGHGVGAELHEEPEVPNFVSPGPNPRFIRGMTVAVEPMINEGDFRVRRLEDGWTVVTADGMLSAHYEHSILVTGGEPVLLTRI